MNVLQEADSLVNGDRQDAYKHPLEDYTCTATMWSAMINKKYGVQINLDPDFCCLLMSAMKLSREAGKHKRDNLVDAAGYVLCAEMIIDLQSKITEKASEDINKTSYGVHLGETLIYPGRSRK